MARTVKCVRLVEANALMHTIANHRSIGFRLTSPSIWTSLTRPSGSITAVDIVDLDITVPKASATSRCLPIDKISTTNNRPSSSYLRVLRETRQNKPERERLAEALWFLVVTPAAQNTVSLACCVKTVTGQTNAAMLAIRSRTPYCSIVSRFFTIHQTRGAVRRYSPVWYVPVDTYF